MRRKNAKFALVFGLMLAMTAIAPPVRLLAADQEVPINGSFANRSTFSFNYPIVHISTDAVGQMSHLGRTTAHSELDVVLGPQTTTGTVTYSAADGSALTGTITGASPQPDAQGMADYDLTVTFTGGTGRFTGASGSAVVHIILQVTGPNSAVSFSTIRGSVSSMGAG